jgi:prolyl-tRNA synthetase
LRLSKLFGNTLREVPADAQMTSHQLLLRAGMVRQVATGIYTYLPLGWRVLRRIEDIIREEMDAIGGQEMLMPSVQPAELWHETGRYADAGATLAHFRDRYNRELVLGITHEEVVTDLARREIHSYRQLPLMVYQIQTKFRDEPRSRGILIRTRESIMKDGYSFHTDQADLDAYYPKVYQAYESIFRRCGVQFLPVEADPGLMGGAASHEFIALHEAGEDTLILCDCCDYAANAESVTAREEEAAGGSERPLELVPTPGVTTIGDLAEYLGVATRQTLKVVFYMAEEELLLVAIRGDREVNEAKLARLLKVAHLRIAEQEEVERAGIVAGYASPIGQVGRVRIVADQSVNWGSNFVAGANKAGYHLRNVNYPRDFQADLLGDIASVSEGDQCARCGGRLRMTTGIELGHIFKLGTRYSELLQATFLDSEGQKRPLVMGCYGIGTGRLMAAVVEQCHDERGIVWPPAIAPYDVHLIALGTEAEITATTESLYHMLHGRRCHVLYDDRDESAGVKFNDADLIGIPLRLTVGSRSLKANAAEIKRRTSAESEIVPLREIEHRVPQLLSGHD